LSVRSSEGSFGPAGRSVSNLGRIDAFSNWSPHLKTVAHKSIREGSRDPALRTRAGFSFWRSKK
jgi:hypothetical protein